MIYAECDVNGLLYLDDEMRSTYGEDFFVEQRDDGILLASPEAGIAGDGARLTDSRLCCGSDGTIYLGADLRATYGTVFVALCVEDGILLLPATNEAQEDAKRVLRFTQGYYSPGK
jgi:hypothetical protein